MQKFIFIVLLIILNTNSGIAENLILSDVIKSAREASVVSETIENKKVIKSIKNEEIQNPDNTHISKNINTVEPNLNTTNKE